MLFLVPGYYVLNHWTKGIRDPAGRTFSMGMPSLPLRECNLPPGSGALSHLAIVCSIAMLKVDPGAGP